jgi:hypothetical protein
MIRLVLFLVSLGLAVPALAETGFQLGLPNLNVPDDPDVRGVRFSLLHGKNRSTRGVDFGLLSMSETSHASGAAFVAGVHYVRDRMERGAAFSLVNYHTGRDSGVNGAFINVLHDTSGAFNIGFITYADGTTGVDLGGINIAQATTVQVGFVNMTERLESFQFGFLNLAENGFLPIFPIFNFPVD